MTFDYTRMAATAGRLLERYGRKAYLRRTHAGTYNPATGTSPNVIASHQVTAAFFDYDQRDIDGTAIRAGDQRVLMAPSAPEPKTGDAIVLPPIQDPKGVYSVVSVKQVKPALVPVLYELQVRK